MYLFKSEGIPTRPSSRQAVHLKPIYQARWIEVARRQVWRGGWGLTTRQMACSQSCQDTLECRQAGHAHAGKVSLPQVWDCMLGVLQGRPVME